MSFYIDEALFKEAVEILRPTIENFLKSERSGGRRSFYLVVDSGSDLFEASFGAPKDTWKAPFDKIARGKAALSRRTGLPTAVVLGRMPWLLEKGDPRYAGGVVEDGLVVAGSGQQAHVDEMFSWMMFNVLAYLCTDAVRDIPDDASHFLGTAE